MEYFDDYSWRAFVALVWPAEPGSRGVAASSRTISSRRAAGCSRPTNRSGRSSTPTDRHQLRRSTTYDDRHPQPVRRDIGVRRPDHRIDIGDRRHRTGRRWRARSAARRPERALRAHAHALQSTSVRSHHSESLLSAERAAGGPASPARHARDQLPDGIARREDGVDRRRRASGAARSPVLHAHRRREARDRRWVRAADDGADWTAHRTEDAEPARSGSGRRSSSATRFRRRGRTRQARMCSTTAPGRRCPKRIRCRSCRSRRSR